MGKYKLLLMTPDGEDYVSESHDSTLNEVLEASENMGSRWVFYPLHFVIKDKVKGINENQRIIDCGGMISWAKGKSINTVRNLLRKQPLEI